MRRALTLSILAACALVVAYASSASCYTLEYLAPNASIHLEFAEADYPNPPTSLAGRNVLDWRDAAAPTNPANEWGWSGHVLGYEPGWYTMLYPDQEGSYICTNTGISSDAIVFAGGCDDNDGRGEFFVDGQLIARMDYYSTPPVHFLLLVDGLPNSTHELKLSSLGGAVALYGGAALCPVPEPSGMLALACGVAGIGGMVSRRKTQKRVGPM